MRTTKRTAANCNTLANIKRTFNAAVYKCALDRLNNQGIDACLDYVVGFYNDTVRAEKRAELAKIWAAENEPKALLLGSRESADPSLNADFDAFFGL